MSGEHQLERSVLEGKERDELHAIADALGLKPASRTKKADLVDKILQVTGVAPTGNGSSGSRESAPTNGTASDEAKPKRPRARKAAATKVDADTPSGADAPSADTSIADAVASATAERDHRRRHPGRAARRPRAPERPTSQRGPQPGRPQPGRP